MMMMQAKPFCQPAIDSNCLRKMMDQKSAWAKNYSKWEADYRVSIIIILIILVVTLITFSGQEQQRKEDRYQRVWKDWKACTEGSRCQGR